MSGTLQSLLRLPPALRYHTIIPVFTPPRQYKSLIECLPRRTFTNTARYCKKPAKGPPKPVLRHRAPPGTAPAPSHAAPKALKSIPGLVEAVLKDRGQVLLYRAPSHTSFYITSYACGVFFLLMALNYVNFTKDRDVPAAEGGGGDESAPAQTMKLPLWSRAAIWTTAVFVTVIATNCILAPTKIIKTISLVSAEAGRTPLLRFQTKPALPFLPSKNRQFQVDPSQVYLDRYVRDASADRITFRDVPLSSAAAFTQSHTNPASTESPSLRSRAKSSNEGLVNIWPSLIRDIRRMFMREGMAFVRVEDKGNWKMDLQGSEMLDPAQTLDRVMKVDLSTDRSILERIRTYVGTNS